MRERERDMILNNKHRFQGQTDRQDSSIPSYRMAMMREFVAGWLSSLCWPCSCACLSLSLCLFRFNRMGTLKRVYANCSIQWFPPFHSISLSLLFSHFDPPLPFLSLLISLFPSFLPSVRPSFLPSLPVL